MNVSLVTAPTTSNLTIMNTLWIVLVVVALLVVWVVVSYNRLVSRRNEVDNAWSQIDVQLKRRLDLIPNLVETVKGYAAFEKVLSKPSLMLDPWPCRLGPDRPPRVLLTLG